MTSAGRLSMSCDSCGEVLDADPADDDEGFHELISSPECGPGSG